MFRNQKYKAYYFVYKMQVGQITASVPCCHGTCKSWKGKQKLELSVRRLSMMWLLSSQLR